LTPIFGDYNEYPENLETLVPKYLPSADSILDYWGNQFTWKKDDQHNFYLISAGPDRIFATAMTLKGDNDEIS